MDSQSFPRSQQRHCASGAAGDAAIERAERCDTGGIAWQTSRRLKTGAVAQYPADRTPQFSTQVFRFLDGSEQRFPGLSGAVLQQWSIRLDLLDEARVETCENFFLSEEGRAGSFTFTDPWDGDGVFELQLRQRHFAAAIPGSAERRDASGGEGEPLGCWFFHNCDGRGGAVSGDEAKRAEDGGEYAGRREHGGLQRS